MWTATGTSLKRQLCTLSIHAFCLILSCSTMFSGTHLTFYSHTKFHFFDIRLEVSTSSKREFTLQVSAGSFCIITSSCVHCMQVSPKRHNNLVQWEIHPNPVDCFSLEPSSDKGEISRKVSLEIFWQSIMDTPNLTPVLNKWVLENTKNRWRAPARLDNQTIQRKITLLDF